MRYLSLAVLVCLGLWSSAATARDTRHHFSVEDALDRHAHELAGVQFYFGDQSHPEAFRTMGEYQSNKKTNAFNKSDREACEWAFLSALLSLKKRALAEGGNAVINIWSNYKRNRFVSDSEFECGAGALLAGVTLRGTVALIEE